MSVTVNVSGDADLPEEAALALSMAACALFMFCHTPPTFTLGLAAAALIKPYFMSALPILILSKILAFYLPAVNKHRDRRAKKKSAAPPAAERS